MGASCGLQPPCEPVRHRRVQRLLVCVPPLAQHTTEVQRGPGSSPGWCDTVSAHLGQAYDLAAGREHKDPLPQDVVSHALDELLGCKG